MTGAKSADAGATNKRSKADADAGATFLAFSGDGNGGEPVLHKLPDPSGSCSKKHNHNPSPATLAAQGALPSTLVPTQPQMLTVPIDSETKPGAPSSGSASSVSAAIAAVAVAVAAESKGTKAKPKIRREGEIKSGGRWGPEEDEILRKTVMAMGAKNWKKISSTAFNGLRSDVQCLHRWQKVLRPGLVKGAWTKVEDDIVIEMVQEHGVGNIKWSVIANRLPGRLGKQCRERWFNHLDPTLKKGPWSAEEDKILMEAQLSIGNKWCKIASLIEGRSENAVKNRWNSAMRRKVQDEKAQRKKAEGARINDDDVGKASLASSEEAKKAKKEAAAAKRLEKKLERERIKREKELAKTANISVLNGGPVWLGSHMQTHVVYPEQQQEQLQRYPAPPPPPPPRQHHSAHHAPPQDLALAKAKTVQQAFAAGNCAAPNGGFLMPKDQGVFFKQRMVPANQESQAQQSHVRQGPGVLQQTKKTKSRKATRKKASKASKETGKAESKLAPTSDGDVFHPLTSPLDAFWPDLSGEGTQRTGTLNSPSTNPQHFNGVLSGFFGEERGQDPFALFTAAYDDAANGQVTEKRLHTKSGGHSGGKVVKAKGPKKATANRSNTIKVKVKAAASAGTQKQQQREQAQQPQQQQVQREDHSAPDFASIEDLLFAGTSLNASAGVDNPSAAKFDPSSSLGLDNSQLLDDLSFLNMPMDFDGDSANSARAHGGGSHPFKLSGPPSDLDFAAGFGNCDDLFAQI